MIVYFTVSRPVSLMLFKNILYVIQEALRIPIGYLLQNCSEGVPILLTDNTFLLRFLVGFQ